MDHMKHIDTMQKAADHLLRGSNDINVVVGPLVWMYCGTVLRQPTALIQAAKDSSPTLALATRS